MKQNSAYFKIYERISNKVGDWVTDLRGAEDDELLEALDMFRYFHNNLAFQYKTNKMQQTNDINKIYETLKTILKELKFERDEINELMTLIKKLGKEDLRKLLRTLGREFYRTARDVEEYLKELEEYSEEELEAINE